MIIKFYVSHPREILIGTNFIKGIEAHGDTGFIVDTMGDWQKERSYDVAVMFGVKNKFFWEYTKSQGRYRIILDKGYIRDRDPDWASGWKYLRASINTMHPTRYVDLSRDAGRWSKLNIGINRNANLSNKNKILVAGSSAKCHKFVDIMSPTPYYQQVVNKLKEFCYDNDIICYRPKPSWQEAEQLEHSEYSTRSERIEELIQHARLLVTHSSNAVFEGLLNCVPCIVLGDAVTKNISATEITASSVQNRTPIPYQDAHRLLCGLAYCQFTQQEFASGFAWSVLKPQVLKDRNDPAFPYL
jgi:hypothetical protein